MNKKIDIVCDICKTSNPENTEFCMVCKTQLQKNDKTYDLHVGNLVKNKLVTSLELEKCSSCGKQSVDSISGRCKDCGYLKQDTNEMYAPEVNSVMDNESYHIAGENILESSNLDIRTRHRSHGDMEYLIQTAISRKNNNQAEVKQECTDVVNNVFSQIVNCPILIIDRVDIIEESKVFFWSTLAIKSYKISYRLSVLAAILYAVMSKHKYAIFLEELAEYITDKTGKIHLKPEDITKGMSKWIKSVLSIKARMDTENVAMICLTKDATINKKDVEKMLESFHAIPSSIKEFLRVKILQFGFTDGSLINMITDNAINIRSISSKNHYYILASVIFVICNYYNRAFTKDLIAKVMKIRNMGSLDTYIMDYARYIKIVPQPPEIIMNASKDATRK